MVARHTISGRLGPARLILERLGPDASPRWAKLEGLRTVWHKVKEGRAAAYWVSISDAALVLSIATTVDSGVKAIWVEGLGGEIAGPVKSKFRLMRDVLAECGQIGRDNGCSEIRIEMGHRQGWKHSLLPKLGFALHDAGALKVMRKAL